MQSFDADLRSTQQARDLAVRAREAQRAFAFTDQEEVDRICAAMVDAAMSHAARLGALAHEETGYGRPDHKRIKNEFAARAVWDSIKDIPTCGVLRRDEQRKIVEIGWPVGVVVALTPSTNPTSTAIYKILISAKARNACIVAPHPSAIRCTDAAVQVMLEAGEAAGMPPGLVSCLTEVALSGTQELMNHHATSLVLATGGPGMVKAAHSVGKPALGVGPGNVPVYVDRTADIERAASDIVDSKAFDCSTICATEQTVVADRPIAAQLKTLMQARGAHWLSEQEATLLGNQMFRPNGMMLAEYVGRTPQAIGQLAGFAVPGDAKILVADLAGVGPAHPISREKLTTVLGFMVEDGWRAGCDRSIQLLTFGGDGHSLVIHSRDEESILAFGIQKPAFRILVNTWGSLGGIGATTGVMPSLTLAPGGIGGAVVSDNITVHHLLNVKRLAYHLRDAPPGARLGDTAPAASRNGSAALSGAVPQTPVAADVELIERLVRQVMAEMKG
ncbi:acetaldehyde dehydrogenase (acetylating) [Kineosphaera limosa]|nr:acetaldehyde dehydrogenase (acetylating) [Kineosphaera limosa]